MIKNADIPDFLSTLEARFLDNLGNFPRILEMVLDEKIEESDLWINENLSSFKKVFFTSKRIFLLRYGKDNDIWDEKDKFISIFRGRLFLKIKKEKLSGPEAKVTSKAFILVDECFDGYYVVGSRGLKQNMHKDL